MAEMSIPAARDGGDARGSFNPRSDADTAWTAARADGSSCLSARPSGVTSSRSVSSAVQLREPPMLTTPVSRPLLSVLSSSSVPIVDRLEGGAARICESCTSARTRTVSPTAGTSSDAITRSISESSPNHERWPGKSTTQRSPSKETSVPMASGEASPHSKRGRGTLGRTRTRSPTAGSARTGSPSAPPLLAVPFAADRLATASSRRWMSRLSEASDGDDSLCAPPRSSSSDGAGVSDSPLLRGSETLRESWLPVAKGAFACASAGLQLYEAPMSSWTKSSCACRSCMTSSMT
mmetsp:Transcript_36835/g.86034  ORF Transcript_36835/g.86034 Transcript_36835/m.86034 type:complete len:293 (-) Transcript_36835:18-896(-)